MSICKRKYLCWIHNFVLPLVGSFFSSFVRPVVTKLNRMMNRSCRADELIEFKYKHTFICKMRVCIKHTRTHSSKHILISTFCINLVKPTSPIFSNVSFFRSLCDKFGYIWMCVCVCLSERVGVAHSNSRRLSTSTRNIYIFIYYFVLCHFFDIWTIWCVRVRVCVCLCLVAKIVAVRCYCCLVRCVLLCRRSRYFLHAIVLGK